LRWTRSGRSDNLEDRRGQSPSRRIVRGGVPLGLGGLAILLVLSLLTKQDLLSMLAGGGAVPDPGVSSSAPGAFQTTPEEEELVDFVSFVLDDAQGTWAEIFPQLGSTYQDARLVLFRNAVESACGFAESAVGPFYCPGDQKVYVDLAFYDDLRRRFGAPGDFAQAYVLAHEIGHHVQRLMGTEAEVRRAQRGDPGAANALSVRMELQADCYAGVWGHYAAQRGVLEAGDLEEGLTAAAAIGDDRLQRMSQGQVVPEAFTHGSSAQRVEWLRRGFDSGDCRQCDTFSELGM
jgi:predicted metalloprotease